MSTLDMRSLMNRLNSVIENAPFEDDSKKNVFESFARWGGVSESEDGKAVEGEVTDGTEDGTLDECDKSDVKETDEENEDDKEEITEGLSESKLAALGREWSQYAGEEVRVEHIKGAIYAFGSELACLRILLKYRFNEKAKAAYSSNLSTWYFSLEVSF